MTGLKNGTDYGTDDNQRFVWLVNAPQSCWPRAWRRGSERVAGRAFQDELGQAGLATIATLRGEPDKAAIFAYERGATMNWEFLARRGGSAFSCGRTPSSRCAPKALACFAPRSCGR
jgi:hypothetical protein